MGELSTYLWATLSLCVKYVQNFALNDTLQNEKIRSFINEIGLVLDP